MDGASKMKFTPKAPVKKAADPVKVESTNSSSDNKVNNSNQNSSSSNGGQQRERKYQDKPQSGRGRGRGRGDFAGGRGFVAPSGQAFFRGNSRNASLAPAPSMMSSNVTRSAPPLIIKKDPDAPDAPVQHVEVRPKITTYNSSDSEEDEENEIIDISHGQEEWPPANFDNNCPVSIPFGPKLEETYKKMQEKQLFAHKNDVEAIAQEELSEMYLVQLPSELRGAVKEIQKKNDSEKVQENVKIGKLKVFESGKIVFTGLDGKEFTVYSGITSSWTQFAMASHVRDTDVKPVLSNRDAKTTAKSASESVNINGDLNMLGSITKKMIVTPDFLINIDSQSLNNNENQSNYDDDVLLLSRQTSLQSETGQMPEDSYEKVEEYFED